MLRRESHKLSLLYCRVAIYETVLDHVEHIAFNEIQVANDHTSNNDKKVKRTMVTFQQAMQLVDAISDTYIADYNKLIVDISNFSRFKDDTRCYLTLYVFSPGTTHVEKRRFCKQYVQIKYLEASWPAALVAHRIQPLPGSMHAHTEQKKASL